jgi:hypothetical protein
MLMSIEQNSVIRCLTSKRKIGSGVSRSVGRSEATNHSDSTRNSRIEKISVMFSLAGV